MNNLMPSPKPLGCEFLFYQSEGNLAPDSVIRNFRITAAAGKNDDTAHYNHAVIKAEDRV